jgi:NAD(P)-dependent dehydrogenase (short-subunit alcohol dehydrogenase family)
MPDDSKQSKPGQARPPQHQAHQPGIRGEMEPRPDDCALDYRGSAKLQGKVALITGGDSGIGRSVAVSYAKEGADVAILYLNETDDAQQARRLIEDQGVRCLVCAGDIGDPAHCRKAIDQAVQTFGRVDVLVNNAAVQYPEKDGLEAIKMENLHHTFRTNVYGMFYLTQAALPYLEKGSAIINSASITAFHGNPTHSRARSRSRWSTRESASMLLRRGRCGRR